jgi:16S rRNA (guanine527-N7)-methyltransferase
MSKQEDPPVAPPAAVQIFGSAIGLAERYAGLLAGPGVERGLLGPGETARLWDRHLLNCAVVAELVPSPCSLIDLGSGAGLPGIVLAMLLPDVTVTLLEPIARRVTFLQECVEILGMANAEVRRGRAEDLAGQLAADVVTARAVAPMDKLAGLAVGLLKPGGLVLAIKGSGAAEEVSRARPVLRRLGARDVEVLRAGSGRVDPAATVVRFTAGRPAGRAGRSGVPGPRSAVSTGDLTPGVQGRAGRGSGPPRRAGPGRGRGRRGPG